MNVAVSNGGRRLLWLSFWFLVLFLYAPILVLIIFSFNARELVSFPWEGFTTRWYHEFLQNQILLDAIRASAFIAAISSVVTTILALPASIALSRRRFFGKGLISGMLLAPLVIPLVVLGTALLILFNYLQKVAGVPLELGWMTITIAHVVIALPFAVLTIVPRMERIPVALEEASRDLGAGAWTAFRTVTFPLLAPAVVSAYLLSFVISFDEVVLASFVGGQTTTFPLYLWSQLRLPSQLPQLPAVAVVVLVLSGIVVVAAEVLRRRTDRTLESNTVIPDDVPDDVEVAPT
jgi:ABC-type spermidine/putrescine transport system permease subunit II